MFTVFCLQSRHRKLHAARSSEPHDTTEFRAGAAVWCRSAVLASSRAQVSASTVLAARSSTLAICARRRRSSCTSARHARAGPAARVRRLGSRASAEGGCAAAALQQGPHPGPRHGCRRRAGRLLQRGVAGQLHRTMLAAALVDIAARRSCAQAERRPRCGCSSSPALRPRRRQQQRLERRCPWAAQWWRKRRRPSARAAARARAAPRPGSQAMASSRQAAWPRGIFTAAFELGLARRGAEGLARSALTPAAAVPLALRSAEVLLAPVHGEYLRWRDLRAATAAARWSCAARRSCTRVALGELQARYVLRVYPDGSPGDMPNSRATVPRLMPKPLVARCRGRGGERIIASLTRLGQWVHGASANGARPSSVGKTPVSRARLPRGAGGQGHCRGAVSSTA